MGKKPASLGLKISLFGGLQVWSQDGETLELSGQKDRALLGFLAVSPGITVPREKLASLLWSESGDKQARDSLKQALFRLRRALEPYAADPFVTTRQSVLLKRDGLWVDVVAFEDSLREGTPESIKRAALLYKGDLLEGVSIRDASFEDWLQVERQRLRALATEAWADLMALALERGRREDTLGAARRLLSLDPLHEGACRALMRIHAERGQRTQALKLFETLRSRLRQELAVEPEPETTALCRSIRSRRAGATDRAGPATSDAVGRGALVATGSADSLGIVSRPTIAVLPFESMSDDPEQQHFADGIADEVITSLARLTRLVVIARNSTLAYKEMARDVRDIAEDLGVRYLLEGSVRRAGQRLRVSAQLIDARSGGHLWAERYDRNLGDLFDLQDEITDRIVTALQVRLTEGEQVAIRRRQTADAEAWECMVAGQDRLHRFSPEDNDAARLLFQRAVARSPDFTSAWSMLAFAHLVDGRLNYSGSAEESLRQGADFANKCLEIRPEDPDGLALLGAIRLCQRRFDQAEVASRRAVEAAPNLADVLLWRVHVLLYTGRSSEALGMIAKAVRVSPYLPAWYLGLQSLGYRGLGQLDAAIAADKARLERNPENSLSNFRLAAIHAERGELEESRAQIAELMSKNPKASIRQVRVCEPYQNAAELERYLGLLRAAGLPE